MSIYDNTETIISSESIRNVGWQTITRYINATNGIKRITFIVTDSNTADGKMELEKLTIQEKTNSTVDATIEFETNNYANSTALVELQFNPFIATETISTVYINGISQTFTPNTYNTFNIEIEKGDSFAVNVEIFSTYTYERALLTFDYVWFYIGFIPTNQTPIIFHDFEYEIDGVPTIENVSLYFQSSTGVQTNSTLVYWMDTSQLCDYDHISDLYIPEQILTINITTIFANNFSYYIAYSTNEWVVPSEVNFQINNEPIIDESYNSGYISFINYDSTLNFSATDSNLIFNYTIESQFRYLFDLDVISTTYLRKT
jgi:hypothetical protein